MAAIMAKAAKEIISENGVAGGGSGAENRQWRK